MVLSVERPAKLAIAVAAASAVLVVVAIRCRRTAVSASDDVDKVLEILNELSRRFFHECRNVAGISKMVRIKLQTNKTKITEESLRAQLSLQCKVFESLDAIQADVAKQFGCTTGDIQSMQQRLKDHTDVKAYTDGFKTMLEDALSGELPLLAKTPVPEDLTQEKVLEIQREAQVLETTRIQEKLVPSKPFDSTALQEASMTAFAETLAKFGDVIDSKEEVYYNAVAIYMKDPDFILQRQTLDEVHQARVMKIIKAFAQKNKVKADP